MCREAPGDSRHARCDHRDRGRRQCPLDMDVIGVPLSGAASQPKPLGKDHQILRERHRIPALEKHRQYPQSRGWTGEQFENRAAEDIQRHDWPSQRQGRKFLGVAVDDLPPFRRTGNNQQFVSSPTQLIDLGNEKRLARAVWHGTGDIDESHRVVAATSRVAGANRER